LKQPLCPVDSDVSPVTMRTITWRLAT
jgi:hypothetical protein